jgi:hypothetical protein
VTRLTFPEWYYGGPFARVSNPDADLPRRLEPEVSEAQRQRTEQHGMFDGEHIVAPFHDGNTAEEILGELFVAMAYPDGWDEDQRYFYPTIQGLLAIIRDRLVEKSRRLRGSKAAWLAEAIPCVKVAAEAYARSDYEGGSAALREVEELVQGAGRAGKRVRITRLGPGSPHGSEG